MNVGPHEVKALRMSKVRPVSHTEAEEGNSSRGRWRGCEATRVGVADPVRFPTGVGPALEVWAAFPPRCQECGAMCCPPLWAGHRAALR